MGKETAGGGGHALPPTASHTAFYYPEKVVRGRTRARTSPLLAALALRGVLLLPSTYSTGGGGSRRGRTPSRTPSAPEKERRDFRQGRAGVDKVARADHT